MTVTVMTCAVLTLADDDTDIIMISTYDYHIDQAYKYTSTALVDAYLYCIHKSLASGDANEDSTIA